MAFNFLFYFITNDKRGNILPQIYECLIIKVSCDENKLMMLFSMKMMGILEKILCLWMSPLWLRGSEGRHHIIHVSCTMVGTNSRKPSKGTSRDQHSLRICILTRTNRHKSSTLIQDKNIHEDWHLLVSNIMIVD